MSLDGYYKDFGYGFYCTRLEKQAKRWALTKKGASVVSRYEYKINEKLKTLQILFSNEEALKSIRFEGSENL